MTPTTHDYTRPYLGHNLNIRSMSKDGKTATVLGLGAGVKEGDYLILKNGTGTTRYRVATWRPDRPIPYWHARIEFAPREDSAC